MNIELYAIIILSLTTVVGFTIAIRSLSNRNKNQMMIIGRQADTIKDLQNRMMAKNYDQYKMYENLTTETLPQEPEEVFDEINVGKISGREKILDA